MEFSIDFFSSSPQNSSSRSEEIRDNNGGSIRTTHPKTHKKENNNPRRTEYSQPIFWQAYCLDPQLLQKVAPGFSWVPQLAQNLFSPNGTVSEEMDCVADSDGTAFVLATMFISCVFATGNFNAASCFSSTLTYQRTMPPLRRRFPIIPTDMLVACVELAPVSGITKANLY
jgi:hypothetical protein